MNLTHSPARATRSAAAGQIVRLPGEGPVHHVLVLRLGGHDVAQISAWHHKGLIHIEHVHTLPAYRRQGHASRLLAAMFARCSGWTLALCPSAFEFPDLAAEHPPPDTQTLTAWYARLGFRHAADGRMHRVPEQAKRPAYAE